MKEEGGLEGTSWADPQGSLGLRYILDSSLSLFPPASFSFQPSFKVVRKREIIWNCLVSLPQPQMFKYSTALEKHKLFISGLPFSCTKEELEGVCKAHGNVKDIRLVTNRAGKPKVCSRFALTISSEGVCV